MGWNWCSPRVEPGVILLSAAYRAAPLLTIVYLPNQAFDPQGHKHAFDPQALKQAFDLQALKQAFDLQTLTQAFHSQYTQSSISFSIHPNKN